MSHQHDFQGKAWPFADGENTAVFTCIHVLGGKSVLHVVHDLDDGAWQFLCGAEDHESEDARILCFGCAVSRDPGFMALADLPLGFMADRTGLGDPWVRSEHPGYDEDE